MKFLVHSSLEGQARTARMADNIRRETGRLMPQPEQEGKITVCGYGPSLMETWIEIGSEPICTTSGAHDFLIERGKVPAYHVEYDPRPHKCDFLRKPHPDVTYCLASTCNPMMFEQLAGYRVLMWHALGPDLSGDATLVHNAEKDGILLLGGSNAGARAISVAHVLGFREFDLHGFDCCYRHNTIWAGPHSGEPHAAFPVMCNDKAFLTSDIMINSAEELTHSMLRELTGCKFRVFGNGLLAERMRIMAVDQARALGPEWWKPHGFELKKVPVNRVQQIDAVITDDYREQNAILHKWNPRYGAAGGIHADAVHDLADELDTDDILDYGCGKCSLQRDLGYSIANYDPAFPELSAPPQPADLVVCTDVLEHIEPQCIDAVLRDLKRVTRRRLYLNIACRPADKVLPDGRNAHLMIREPQWWEGMLAKHFKIISSERKPGEVTLLCEPA